MSDICKLACYFIAAKPARAIATAILYYVLVSNVSNRNGHHPKANIAHTFLRNRQYQAELIADCAPRHVYERTFAYEQLSYIFEADLGQLSRTARLVGSQRMVHSIRRIHLMCI